MKMQVIRTTRNACRASCFFETDAEMNVTTDRQTPKWRFRALSRSHETRAKPEKELE